MKAFLQASNNFFRASNNWAAYGFKNFLSTVSLGAK